MIIIFTLLTNYTVYTHNENLLIEMIHPRYKILHNYIIFFINQKMLDDSQIILLMIRRITEKITAKEGFMTVAEPVVVVSAREKKKTK